MFIDLFHDIKEKKAKKDRIKNGLFGLGHCVERDQVVGGHNVLLSILRIVRYLYFDLLEHMILGSQMLHLLPQQVVFPLAS